MAIIESTKRLRELIGTPNEIVHLKIHSDLNETARAFIAQSPMAFLTTSDSDNMPTVSPKGDAPGFVHVEDRHTLIIPERKGNKLAFSLDNILHNPRIGLIFLVPGSCETLRVQGRAELDDDAALCKRLSARGSPALLVTRIHVEAAYFHCAKAFLRSDLWNHKNWSNKVSVSFGKEIAQRGGLDAEKIDEFDDAVRARYKSDL